MSKATFQNTFSKFTSFLNFNKGMSLASVTYGTLLASLQVTLDANEQVGKCTSYAEFLFWIGFSVLCFGSVADLFYDSARMVRQWIGMTTRTMDPLWGDKDNPYRPKKKTSCRGLCTIEPDERVPSGKPFNYFCYFSYCKGLCHTSVPSDEVHDVDFECCSFNGIEFCQEVGYKDETPEVTIKISDSEAKSSDPAPRRRDAHLLEAPGNPLTEIEQDPFSGSDQESQSKDKKDDTPPKDEKPGPKSIKIKKTTCNGGKFVLLVLTLLIRFVSNLALALAIPTATMYNYLHETETKAPATPAPPPPAGVPAPTEGFDCFISSNSLEDLLIASNVAALFLIIIRSVLPTWSKLQFKYEFGG